MAYFISWLYYNTIIIYFVAQIVPKLATGNAFNLAPLPFQ